MTSRSRQHNPAGPLRRAAYSATERLRFRLAGRPDLRDHARRTLKSLGVGFAYAALVEPKWIECTQTEIHVPGLPPSLDGYRIAHLSDVHHNMAQGRTFLPRVIERTNALDADLVALTGDFVTHDPRRMHDAVRQLAALRAPDGVFACRGNHDYVLSLQAWRHAFEGVGIHLLENQHVLVHRQRVHWPSRHREHGSLVVAGVGDLWHGASHVGRALRGAPEHVTRILLAHNPQVAEVVTECQRIALTLSGHTHGGQVRLFNKSHPLLSDGTRKYVSGRVRAPHTEVYVSRGVGTSALHLRWNCRPEVALVILRRAPRHP